VRADTTKQVGAARTTRKSAAAVKGAPRRSRTAARKPAASPTLVQDRLQPGLPEIPPDTGVTLAVAKRVREVRQELGFTVGQLAERSGISKGMLSKIENAQASPSLATLGRLSSALSVPVTSFFRGLDEEHDAVFVAAGSGIEIVRQGTRTGHRYQLLGTLRGPSRRMEPLLVTLTERTEVFPLFQHDGTELIYMLDGIMRYGSGMSAYLLQPGDALQFDGSVAHGPAELIELPIRFLSVIATANGGR
jgi:transcriptional regulator with XRE-family HTH domain